MLDKQDLISIKQLLDESFAEFAAGTLNKSFQGVQDQLDRMEDRLVNVETDVKDLRAALNTQYPDKAYLDAKLATTESNIILRIQVREQKERSFKLGVLELLEKYSSAPKSELAELRDLI